MWLAAAQSMLGQPPASRLWTVVAFFKASTSLSRVVAAGPFAFTFTTASEKSAPFQVGYFHALMALSGLFFRGRLSLFPASFTP